MNLADVRHMLNIVPRYTNNKSGKVTRYHPEGVATCFNGFLLPGPVEKALRRALDKQFPGDDYDFTVKAVDISNAFVLHIGLQMANLRWLTRNIDWQKWSPNATEAKALPIVIRFQAKLVVWNGTHRSLICRMLGKKLRCKFIDLDAAIARASRGKR
jgi:hypothetical protein